MAWRNLWRNPRRTAITIAAMALALLVLVLYTSLFEGYLVKMERNLVEVELGDVQIFAPDYRDKPSLYATIQDPDTLVDELEGRGLRATARLLGGGLAASDETSAGGSLRGIDVEQDAHVSEIYRRIAEGEWLDPSDSKGVVLGGRLARTLDVEPGDELVVVSQASDGSIANDLYTVRGVLELIGESTDRSGIFMTEEAFRELFVLPEGVHQVMVRRAGVADFDAAVTEVRELATGLDVASWKELNPTLASLLDSTRGMMYVICLVIYLAVGILILNATLMAVFERIREFGILKAVGVGPERVLALILLEGGLQTATAVAIALTLSVPGLWYLRKVGLNLSVLGGGVSVAGMNFDPIWQAHITPNVFIGPLATLLVIVLVGTLYPAVKAARLSPVEAIQHQ
jgi:ABC-type lipoprotein release transport system permease subunit